MAENRLSGNLVIWLTILVAMVLVLIPLPSFVPAEVGFLRPDLVIMVLIYWIMALPHRVGIATAWVVGLAMDITLGSLLGRHALVYVLVAFLAVNLYQRLRMFTIWQQALIIFAILGISRLIDFWIASFTGQTGLSLWRLLPAASGALLWPWVFMFLRYLRRKASLE